MTNWGDNTVSVINTATNGVETTITGVGSHPGPLIVTPDGTRAYVASTALQAPTDTGVTEDIVVIDLVSRTVEASIALPEDFYLGLARSPDGTRAYTAATGGSISVSLSVIDTGTNTSVEPAINLGPGQPRGIVVSPDGTRVYVVATVGGDGHVEVIETGTNSAIDQIPDGAAPYGVAVTPDGTRVYVANSGSDTVSVIDTGTNEIVGAPIPVGANPRYLAVTPDGTRLYVTNNGVSFNTTDGSVSVIDVATNTVTTTIPVDDQPYAIAIGPGPDITAVAADPVNPQTVYAGTAGAGMYRSLDGGTAWTAINTGITALDVTALVIASDGSALYAGTRTGGVFKSTDGGASWAAMNNGLDPRILSLEIAGTDNQTLYAGVASGGGVYKTTDGGVSWTAMSDGLPDADGSP